MGGSDYYTILGVSPASEDVVIDAAYKALMKKYHPDRDRGADAEAEVKAKRINEAYHVLRDPARRAAYDAERRARAQTRASPPAPPPPPPSPRQPSPPKPPPSQPPGAKPPIKVSKTVVLVIDWVAALMALYLLGVWLRWF